MPVIVYKTMTIEALWLQPRRIVCDGCGKPYVYLARGRKSTQVTGVPVLSDEEAMQRSAAEALEKQLAKIGARDKKGEGMCPHCQVYQHWMVAASRLWNYGVGAGIGFVVGAVIGFALFMVGELSGRRSAVGAAYRWATEGPVPKLGFFLALLFCVACAAVGMVVMSRKVISRGPHTGMQDSASMTDDAWVSHLAGCAERDYQPVLAWWAMIGGTFPEKIAVVPLEPYDAAD